MTLANKLYEEFIFSNDLYEFAKLAINSKEENWNKVARIQTKYDSLIILFSFVANYLLEKEVIQKKNN